VLNNGTALTAGDRMSLDVAAELRTTMLVDVVSVLTDLGGFPITCGLVAVAAALLAWRRRPAELLALVIGFALVVLVVQAAKSGIGRERPEGGLTAVEGQSYPSGHAAYATAYVALAIVAARVLPNLAARAALIGATLGMAAFVGLSRIYLGVHYWSDVAGGWGLGFGTFALCGAAALLFTHIRHNGGRELAVPSDHG
jgi:undecaprenyl-diphosphatase